MGFCAIYESIDKKIIHNENMNFIPVPLAAIGFS